MKNHKTEQQVLAVKIASMTKIQIAREREHTLHCVAHHDSVIQNEMVCVLADLYEMLSKKPDGKASSSVRKMRNVLERYSVAFRSLLRPGVKNYENMAVIEWLLSESDE